MAWQSFDERQVIALENISYSLKHIDEKLNLIWESQNERKKTRNS